MATTALSARALPRSSTTKAFRPPSLRLRQWQSRQIASAATAASAEHSDIDTFTPHQQRQNRQESIRQAKPFSEFLTDNFSRQHDYLRISLTERCNLRCLYCMPEEGIQLSPNREILTTAEIHYLSALFVNQGVNKIRLTGGEPTVRKDIIPLMQQIGSLRRNGLKELALTTNGISLHRKLDDMVEAGLTGVNISLDTLDPFQFQLLTRRQGFSAVMKSINRVKEMNKLGAEVKLKINCVVMRGLNDHQILPFVDMTQDENLEVRFIEYMPFGGNKWSENKMMTYEDMLIAIREKYPAIARLKDAKNDTSKTWQVPGFAGRVGFITSMTHNFCGSCNRLRITSDGNLKVCLHGETEVSLRDLLRNDHGGEPMDEEAFEAIRQIELSRRKDDSLRFDGEEGWMSKEQQLLDVIGAAVKRKKAKHAGMGQLENMKNRPMILIGGSNWPAPAHQITASGKNFWSSIPTHLLRGPPAVPFGQARFYSSDSKDLADGGAGFQSLSALHSEARPTWRYSRPREMQSSANDAKETFDQQASDQSSSLDSSSPAALDVSQTPTNKRAGKPENPEHNKPAPSIDAVDNSAVMNDGTPNEHLASGPSPTDYGTKLTHVKPSGEAHMVDVGAKPSTQRTAIAIARIRIRKHTHDQILENTNKKGDVLGIARIAGIMAAKRTSDLIPLCHPLAISKAEVDVHLVGPNRFSRFWGTTTPHFSHVMIQGRVECVGPTGVEMEALTAVQGAALTVVDMCKAVEKGLAISDATVVYKAGGRSGVYVNKVWKKEVGMENFSDDTGELLPDVQDIFVRGTPTTATGKE
ncbi:hypothetical protein Q7P37_010710 [Cladosporium fusiforme]